MSSDIKVMDITLSLLKYWVGSKSMTFGTVRGMYGNDIQRTRLYRVSPSLLDDILFRQPPSSLAGAL
jgi:hypothetical protein